MSLYAAGDASQLSSLLEELDWIIPTIQPHGDFPMCSTQCKKQTACNNKCYLEEYMTDFMLDFVATDIF